MYSYIIGTVVEKTINGIILENNNIGYDIQVSANTVDKVIRNNIYKIYTYFKASDEGVSLFGFYSHEEKNMFLKLINVNGVGAKVAIGILSALSPTSLINAIATQDIKLITQAKGVGKKMAERIILELKDKVDFNGEEGVAITPSNLDNDSRDAIEALKSLGITYNEAYKAVTKVREKATGIEDLIALALKSVN